MPRVSDVFGGVTALGPGRRLGVWFQGCGFACPGCMSRHTWDPAGGRELPVDRFAELWQAALDDGTDGLTVSGGEPLDQPDALAELLAAADERRARSRRPADRMPDFLVYTGREPEEIAADPALDGALRLADAVVTGRYDVTRPTALVWRGSANQRLTARTALGATRYGPHLERRTDRPALQPRVADGRLRLVGIPRRGELAALERELRRRGVFFEETSWRP
jgi:anaerobic ribonucleoside-triphosphate reductase activating protein